MEGIKRCKVCGGEPNLVNEYTDYYRVKCECGRVTTTLKGSEAAIKDWNDKNK